MGVTENFTLTDIPKMIVDLVVIILDTVFNNTEDLVSLTITSFVLSIGVLLLGQIFGLIDLRKFLPKK